MTFSFIIWEKLRRLLGCYFRVFKTTCQDNQDKFAPWYPCELQLPEYIFNEVIPHLHTHCCFLYLYCVFIYFFQEMLIKILFSEIAFIRLLKKMKQVIFYFFWYQKNGGMRAGFKISLSNHSWMEPYDRVYVLTRNTLNAQKLPRSLLNVLRGCRKWNSSCTT